MMTRHNSMHRNSARTAALLLALVFAALSCVTGFAQVSSYGDKTEGENTGDQLPTVLQHVQVTQHLNAQLPLNAAFVDDTGAPVTLGKYFDGKHPAIVSTVYYNCPMLCSEEMDGLVSALMMVHLVPGKDFQVVLISIDPTETPAARREEEGLLPQALRPSRDRRRLALSHRPASRHRRRHQRHRLRLCPRPRAGRQARPVRARQLHPDRDAAGQARAVLPRRGVLAQGRAARPHRRLRQQDRLAGREHPDLLLPLRSAASISTR